MTYILQNQNIEIHIDSPTENYQFSRFDWTGKIVAVKFKGKYVSGNELPEKNNDKIHGKGFYNEFGIEIPVGFDEIEEGAWFHKIGVGLLKKEGAEYRFHESYKIRSADFEMVVEPDKIRIICQAQPSNGYAYHLEKEIILLESGFEIRYHLKNTGEKAIITNEYNHNFLSIDQTLMGKDYVLTFPFQMKPALFGANVNPEGAIQINDDEIRFLSSPKEQFFFSNLSGGETVQATWTLKNIQRNIAISETGDFQTNAINLWGWGHIISPELFIDLNIAPGQVQEWKRTYDIYEIG